MSTSYYLRDKKITIKKLNDSDILINKFNIQLLNQYEELNKKLNSIIPINNEEVFEECRQYAKEYKPTIIMPIEINDYKIGATSGGKFKFKRDKFYSLDDFQKFYKRNSDKYKIVDEYEQTYTLNEFIKKIKSYDLDL